MDQINKSGNNQSSVKLKPANIWKYFRKFLYGSISALQTMKLIN